VLKGLLGACGLAAMGKGFAQEFPNRPIRLIVPYAAGGAPELYVRPMAHVLSQKLGQQLVIEYKPGANSQIGAAYVAKAPADGYTVVFVSDAAMSIAPALNSNLPYDAQADFTPVSILAHFPYLLVTNPNTGITNARDFLAQAKAKPGAISYGSLGIGSTAHVAMEFLAQQQGVEVLHVPYQGTGPAMTAVLGGEVNTVFSSMGPSLPHIRAGRLRPVAVAGRTRSPLLPEVPTFIEQGIPNYEVSGWFGIVAPRNTPDAALQVLRREMWAYVSSKEFTESVVLKNGYEPTRYAPADADTFLREDRTKWAAWVKKVEPRIRKTS
jgi:tripartite-type tricarboxylate transporter receptor subunit TctC